MASPFDRYAALMYSRMAGVFGEPAELIFQEGPATKPSFWVRGIYTHSSTALGEGMVITDFVTTFEVKAEDCPPPRKGDSIRVRGELFKIADIQRDTASILKLILQKVSRLKNVKKR